MKNLLHLSQLVLGLLWAGMTFAQDLSEMKSRLLRVEDALVKHLELRENGISAELVPFILTSEMTANQKALIRDWYDEEVKFQKEYDHYQNLKLDYFALLNLKEAKGLAGSINNKKVQSEIQKLEILTKEYFEKKDLFGTREDYLRVVAYRDMSKQHIVLSNIFRKSLRSTIKNLPTTIEDTLERLALLPNQIEILQTLKYQQNSPQGETPIIDAMGKAMRKMGRQEQITVKWLGLGHMPRPEYDGQTVNIVAFEHANPLLDTLAQAEIPPSARKGIGFFGVAKYVFPDKWVKMLRSSDHYIVVNEGQEIPRTLEIIGAKKLHGFFASAEGLSPAGMFETRPVSPLFTDTYWELKKLGLRVNIVPMGYPKNFRLFDEWKHDKSKNKSILGVVSPALPSEKADVLAEITGETKSVAIWLRSVWHEQLKNEALILGSPSVEDIEEMVQKRLWD